MRRRVNPRLAPVAGTVVVVVCQDEGEIRPAEVADIR